MDSTELLQRLMRYYREDLIMLVEVVIRRREKRSYIYRYQKPKSEY